MEKEKIVTLEQMQIVKDYIDGKNAASIKAAEYTNNTVKLYTTADKSGEPAVTLNLPEQTEIEYAADEEVQELFSD